MCGIFGIVARTEQLLDISGSLNSIMHRGPDDEGMLYWHPTNQVSNQSDRTSRVALGHRRLSILDLSPLGHQPMSTSNGRWHMVYNGEVYNYCELRTELEALGHRFTSDSDTEVVLTALTHWGHEKALARFTGMFAIALLDTQENTLLLARDPFGIKPLYLCRYEGGLAFSSEIKPLLALPSVDTTLNAQGVFEYLRYGITDCGDQSMLQGIRQVPAGNWVKSHIDDLDGFFKFNIYWDIEKIKPVRISFDEAVKQFRAAFLESITLHLRSDVPVGCALSGGLDSSAIVCAIRYLNPTQEIHTFSFIADEARINESKWVDIVNAHVGAIAHPIHSGSSNLADDLGVLMQCQDEPFGSTSIYAQHLVMKEAKRAGITVMLDGQGADEMLGGYPWYQSARWISMLRQFKFKLAWNFIKAQSQWPDRNALSLIAHAVNYLLPTSLLSAARQLTGHSDAPLWINKKWFSDRNVKTAYPYHSEPSKNQLHRVLKDNTSRWGLAQLLRYEDRNSMAFSIESRVPFLTTKLVELALSLPEEYLISNNGASKHILRESLRGIVPDVILDRRDKIGFAAPESSWLQDQPEIITNTIKYAKAIDCFDKEKFETFVKDVTNGKTKFNSSHIWKLINFVHWHHNLK